MARKLRLEFPGAIYHVLSRGNYRKGIFEESGTRMAFEKCLNEACLKSGWIVHAYCLMSNHYHLALETPEGNLVSGMSWLQSTFANRFNRFRDERGHVFQGRYKSLLVEDGAWLGNLCHYIHLNPVRARLCNPAGLRNYPHSSYFWLFKPKERPEWLSLEACLDHAGDLSDSPAGWEKYADYLEWLAEEEPMRKKAGFDKMSSGWALGSQKFRTELIEDNRKRLAEIELGERDLREVREFLWEEYLEKCLRILSKNQEAIEQDRKSAGWKVAIAALMKETTQVPNNWLAEKLNMGSCVSRYVGLFRKGKSEADPYYKELKSHL